MIKVIESKTNYNELELSFKYTKYFVNAVKELKHRKYNPETKSWVIEKNELPALIKRLGSYNFDYEAIQMMHKIEPQSNTTCSTSNIKNRLQGSYSIAPFNFKTKPLPHQIEAFNYGISNNAMLIGDDMGLGKTMESLNIACYRHSVGQVHKCLIICGINATKYNWAEEIEKHTYEQYVVFDQKSVKKKIEAIDKWKNDDVFFGIINIEALRATNISKKEISNYISNKIPVNVLPKCEVTEALSSFVDMVIADEIHKMKNGTTKQGIALQQINPMYKLGLSGTPLTNHIEDLWNIMKWFGRCNVNYWTFRDLYCVMGGYNEKEVVGYKNLHELANDVRSIMLRRRKDEVLNLPNKIYQKEYIELAPATMKYYNEVKKGIIKKLSQDGSFKNITLSNALTSMLRLRQITEGIDGVEGEIVPLKDNPKFERIKMLLDEEIIPNGKKAIIFSSWKTTADIYKQLLAEYNPAFITGDVPSMKRQEEVNRFQNDPTCKIAIGTIGAMGTGYTMTAGEYVFFIDKYWNETDNKQAEDRAHRIGVKNNVVIVSMIAKDTIDEKIEKLLKEKSMLFDLIVDNNNTHQKETEDIVKELLGL